jgi:hypothetical protein
MSIIKQIPVYLINTNIICHFITYTVLGGKWCTMDMVPDFGRMLSCTTDSLRSTCRPTGFLRMRKHTYISYYVSRGPGPVTRDRVTKVPTLCWVDDKTINGSRSKSRSVHIHQFSIFRWHVYLCGYTKSHTYTCPWERVDRSPDISV